MDLKIEFDNYIEICINERGLSQHTIKAYKIDMKQYISYIGFISIEKGDLLKYIKYLHKFYKPKTVRRKIASLKAFCHYLYCEDIITDNPFGKININFKEPQMLPRTIPHYLIQDILKAVYTNVINSKTTKQKILNIRNAAVIELLFATGGRVSEICSLRIKDVDLISKTVKIFGKGSKERIIQIENPDVINILSIYQEISSVDKNSNRFFFLNNKCHRLSEQSVRNMLCHIEKQIKSPIHITPHMFRHSVATMLLEEDVDIRYIQKILGHSSIATTQIYTNVTSSKQREILRTKHPRNKMYIDYNKSK